MQAALAPPAAAALVPAPAPAEPSVVLGASPYPPGATNANWFGLFNAVSWQITLGSPAILYAKSLGAPATVLGIIASLTPLLVILQLPAVNYLHRFGYRRFMLAGWGSRTLCIFGLAVVPLVPWTTAPMRLALVLLLLLAFNLLRGMASGAWLPWMSELIPESVRGRFLSRDQIFCQIGSLGTLLAAALVLSGHPQPWQFALVFGISALGATASLFFIRRIPDVTAPDRLRRSGHRVPWMHMMLYRPFLRLLVFNLLNALTVSSLAVFTVAFLKGVAGYSESTIVYLTTLPVLGAICTVPWLGRFLDRTGSKPVFAVCLGVILLAVLGWWMIAAGLIRQAIPVIAVLYLALGVGGTNFAVANNRIMMATMPLMGRNHFFALFTVISSLAMGLAPIVWGIVLDAIGGYQVATGLVHWNRYSIYFASVCIMAVITSLFVARLEEDPQALAGRSVPVNAAPTGPVECP